MRVCLLKKHKQNNPAHNKRSLHQGPSMFNNQKVPKRSEETNLAPVVLEKNINTATVDEDYFC